MSTGIVYKLFVKSVAGVEHQVGPGYDSGGFPFLFKDSLEEAEEHYKGLGLETRTEERTMEFDDRG